MASFIKFYSFFTLVFCFFFSCCLAQARQILVGGAMNAWKVPESSNKTLNQWAERTRFKIGDVLVWIYDPKLDSVLQVTKQGYETCNTSKPITEHKEGNTKIQLDKSGPHYFISGANGNCGKGEKLIVVVLSPNHWLDKGSSPAPAPGPTPTTPTTPTPGKNSASGLMMGRGFWAASLFALGFVLCLA